MRNVWENALYNLRNSARFHPQNDSNPISGTLYFKIFPGGIALGTPLHQNAKYTALGITKKKKGGSCH
jgi:hypothetical protein